jgi:epoxyqueuosine reductase
VKESIRRRALELGFDDCRFTTAKPPATAAYFESWLSAGHHGEMGYLQRNAHKRNDPQLVLPGARSIISLAVSYAGNGDVSREDGLELHHHHAQGSKPRAPDPSVGSIARYARFRDYHNVIGERLKVLTQLLDRLEPQQSRSLWYVDTGPLLERDFAQRAGLGFVGKHTNVISRRLGNWFFLAEVLTTLEFAPDEPEKNRCGSCVRCIDACPTQAITAPFCLDARRCISYLTIEHKGPIPEELRPAIGNRIFGCDDCLQACPWNRFAQEGKMMREYARHELAAPDLASLLPIGEAEFKARFAGTPIVRAKRAGLLRNVCVALGNIGLPEVLPALERIVRNEEPLVAEHAAWAMRRIEQRGSADSSG